MTTINAGLVVGLTGALCGGLMALLALLISRAPGWRELRSFALVSITAAAYCFFDLVHVLPVSRPTLEIGEGLAVGACLIYGLAWIRHLAIADRKPLGMLGRAAPVAGAIVVVLAFVPGALVGPPIRTFAVEWFGVTYTTATATPLGLGCVAFSLVALLVTAFGRGHRWRTGGHARLPMIGALVIVATGISDTLGYMQIVAAPQLIEAATVVVVGTMGVSYAQRFIADARRLEALSTELEQQVANRTMELLASQAMAADHERLAGLGRIAAGVAHEINNPTAVIQQNLDRMRALLTETGTLGPELASRFDRSRAATQHIAGIVRQLLDTGRQGSTDNADAMPLAVRPIVERAIVAASAMAPALHVTVSLADSLCVRGNARSLEQVLINLLVNAAHAANDAPQGARARVEGARDGDCVRFRVIDNGTGIPAAVRDRLFEPFATTKPIGQGTGLGLAVSRGLMTRQRGSLVMASSTSAGTEMVLELPAADAAEVIDVPAPAPPPAVPNGAPELRVLVIDDNEDLRDVLVLQLDRFFHVDAADTVDQALAMVGTGRRYDAVLCDLMMPSGGAESWFTRCDAQLADRTILLTGGATTEAASELIARRGEHVMFKPPDMNALRPMIERLARLSLERIE